MPVLIFLGGAVAVFITCAIDALWGGYVLTVLWAWFVVPTFGLPALTLAPAIGLMVVVGYMTKGRPTEDEDDFLESVLKDFFFSVMRPALALFFGWIVHLFM